jgi:hypothetical protein
MKNEVKNPQSPIEKPNIKTKRANIQKEYYVLRDDVFEFIGVFTEASATKLKLSRQSAEA